MSDTTSIAVEWKEPPPAKGGRLPGRLAMLVEQLKQNPGNWAVIYRRPGGVGGVSSYATSIKRRYGIEVTCRTEDGSGVIYARWPVSS